MRERVFKSHMCTNATSTGAAPDGADVGLLLVEGVVPLLQPVLQQPDLRLPLQPRAKGL